MSEAITTNFVLCTCPKKAEHYCKNWDGKGNVASRAETLKTDCQENPEECKFLVEPKKRKGADWIYQAIAGSPLGKTAVATPEKEPETKTEPAKSPPKKPGKKQSLTCAECGEDATHKIDGYRPTFLCILHAEEAQAKGFKLEELKQEGENNA